MCEFLNISDEIAFKTRRGRGGRDPGRFHLQENMITITDTTLGKLSVTKDIVLSYARLSVGTNAQSAHFKIMYRGRQRILAWSPMTAKQPCFALQKTDERKTGKHLLAES
jgi:hypothetical protein